MKITRRKNKCTLTDMFRLYNTGQDVISDYMCTHCQRRGTATENVRINCYPNILCIVLGHNQYRNNIQTRLKLAVDYPLESFKLKNIFGSHAGTDDVTYNLVAAVNQHQTGTDQGHYTTISLEQTTGQWYKCDDHTVEVADFINRRTGGSVKMDYQ
jgi:ubiquitin C-terminal hydrolase